MVATEEVPLQTSAVRGAPAFSRRTQLAAVTALVCISLLVAPLLVSRETSAGVVLEEKDDEISDNLLGALEKAMDKSIDNKVEAFMSAPGVASIPVPDFPEKDEHAEDEDKEVDEIPKNYLFHLQAEKEALEKKREGLLSDLRKEHAAVATEAAKQSAEANKVRLERALYGAKKRQLEHAQDAARQAAKKMREALIAKQQAIHAEAVAKARAHILDSMVSEAQHGAPVAVFSSFKAPSKTSLATATPSFSSSSAAAPTQAAEVAKGDAEESKAAVAGTPGGSLARYEAQEKVLLKKIAAAKRKAKLAAAEVSGKASSEGAARTEEMEGKVIETLAKTVKKNQGEIESDEARAAQLKKQELKLLASVKAMKAKNTALEVKEKVLAH